MAEISYYDILHIDRGATLEEIKRAYRKLAMKWHPDKNPDDPDEASKRFQDIAEAYEVLSDAYKRAIFDQYGFEGLRDGIPDGSTEGYSYRKNANEIFEKFFGTSNPFAKFGFSEATPFASKLNKPDPQKPNPVLYTLECSLTELYNGATKKFSVTRKRIGSDDKLIDDSKLMIISVKAGWKKGTKVTFPNEGDTLPGFLPQDIIFIIAEKEDKASSFKRDGNNLIYTHKISLSEALTDCSIQIPTMDSRILSIACPEVVSPEYEKIVIGEGMPISKSPGSKGDLIIRFHILFPKYLNGNKRNKIKELLANEDLLN